MLGTIDITYIQDREMANREEGAATLNRRQGQEQPQHQDAVRQRHIHLNWSNFKPKFSGKPEDAEAHLLCLNDWMEAHHFDADIRVQSLPHTIGGSKIVVPFLRTFGRDYMGTITKFI